MPQNPSPRRRNAALLVLLGLIGPWGLTKVALAFGCCVPELNGGSLSATVTLLVGALLMFRQPRKSNKT